MQIDKNAIRHEFLFKRNTLSSSEIEQASDNIFAAVLKTDEFLHCRNILLYASYKSEIATYNFFNLALKCGKNVYFPKCYENYEMKFFKVTSLDDLKIGMYGIYEPDTIYNEYINSADSLCIVPGVCFDKKGYRLGYGKGYYDRFLYNFKGKSIGVAMDEFVVDKLPVFPTDIKIDTIITDKNIYREDGLI